MAEKTFLIVNRRSGKALQATGLDNGLVVEQSDVTYQDSQLWQEIKVKGEGEKGACEYVQQSSLFTVHN